MKKIKYLLLIFAITGCMWACNENDENTNTKPETILPDPDPFAKGADLGWLTEMEAAGSKFYDSTGIQTECMELMRDLGMNAIRLRAWVNPADGWCNTEDMIIKAWRAKQLGMRIMVDFHYSDSWADPGKQTKPAAWATMTLDQLTKALSDYTVQVLQALKGRGITPEWVQVGNETTSGMLWDSNAEISGNLSANNGANYAKLHNAGYDAVKSVFPNAKVILHIDRGNNNSLTKRMFDNMITKHNGKVDIIGLSLYPSASTWKELNESCRENMQWIVNTHGKEVMICEVGMDWNNPVTAKDMLTDLMAKTRGIKNADGKQMGLGVFYWEPESYAWKDYSKGACDLNGVPTKALDAFARTK